MKTKTLAAAVLATGALFAAFADTGVARFSAVVIDERSKKPIEGVPVTGCFTSRYMRWDDKASVDDAQSGRTDSMGRCEFLGKTNTGEACVRVRRYPGYYDSEILHVPYTNADCAVRQPVWKPDNVVVTLTLQRVERPIPLFVKAVRLKVDSTRIAGNQGRFAYDLVEGAWLPPFGSGKQADVEFSCLPRERLEDGKSSRRTVPRYRNSIRVEFVGADNGICEMPTTSATLRIRNAPQEGYKKGVTIWRQLSAGLNAEEGGDAERNYCFRIRTRRNEEGRIVESYYGKIYGDIELCQKYDGDIPSVVGVRFLYYLNPNALDRNLEYKIGTNLNPSRHNHVDRPFKP